MATVKCVSLEGDSLPNGRRLPPGASATDIDVTDPDVLARIQAGRLVITSEDFDVAGSKIADVLAWVGDDADRATAALAAESGRPDSDQRSSLTDKLTELVAAHTDSSQED